MELLQQEPAWPFRAGDACSSHILNNSCTYITSRITESFAPKYFSPHLAGPHLWVTPDSSWAQRTRALPHLNFKEHCRRRLQPLIKKIRPCSPASARFLIPRVSSISIAKVTRGMLKPLHLYCTTNRLLLCNERCYITRLPNEFTAPS